MNPPQKHVEPIMNDIDAESIIKIRDLIFNSLDRVYPPESDEHDKALLDVTLKHGIEMGVIYMRVST